MEVCMHYCDLRGQIKGTAHTFTSFIVRSVRYGQYRTFNNRIVMSYSNACASCNGKLALEKSQ